MKRPHIALWIKWHVSGFYIFDDGPVRWCPNWLWTWAVRRVDRWHVERELVRLHGQIDWDYPRWRASDDPDAKEWYIGWKP